MKRTRRILSGLWLVAALLACSLPAGLPAIPPGWTVTPSITPTLTTTPSPTPTPTPPPLVRVENGDRALFNGDTVSALAYYQAAYRDSSDPAIRAAARWGEGRVHFADGRYVEALAALQSLISEYPDSPYVAQAYFLQGQTLDALKRYAEAAAAWQMYLSLRPGVIDAYTQERRGDALSAAGNLPEALSAYLAAEQSPRLDDHFSLAIKIAQTYSQLGDYANALERYNDILARTTNDYVKAQVTYLSGLAYKNLGQKTQAYDLFRSGVENYPLSYYSYLGLVELVDAGEAVSELDRGLVDYFAGQYPVALAAFDRFLAANPVNDGTAHYYRALTLRELKESQAAIDEFTLFIQNYPNHPKWSTAWFDKAYTQWAYLNQYPQAAQTLLDFVALQPAAAEAPDYLMTAARLFEQNGNLEEAARTWTRLSDDYPGATQAPTAIFFAGIVHYRQGNFSAALSAFQRSLSLAVQPEDRARAFLWIGKAQEKLGDSAAKQSAWQQAVSIDPGGYYSERARDLLIGRPPFAPPSALQLTFDLAAERSVADTWARLTFHLPAESDLSGPGALISDPRLIRGTELWNLGLYDEARLEFEDLRKAVSNNPIDSYRLANYLLDLGLYRPAIFAARQVLTLAGLDEHSESMMAPPYFSHLRYGLYYADLVNQVAQEYGFDPLLLFSIIRQESLFEGFVHSTAGARGLMQIIPSTGASLAGQLGWPSGYDDEDLYRPNVSIRLGTFYLATNRQLLGGDLYAMLAAYNGGPGNAALWKDLAGNDPDLFLEVVRFEETRQYIRNIYEIYTIYRRLYGSGSE